MAGIRSWFLKFYTINQYMQLSNMQLSDTVCSGENFIHRIRVTPVLLVAKDNQLAHFPIYVVFPVFVVQNVTSFRGIRKTDLDAYISN